MPSRSERVSCVGFFPVLAVMEQLFPASIFEEHSDMLVFDDLIGTA